MGAFATEGAGKTWNKRFAGKPAMTHVDATGYNRGYLNGKNVMAHRAAWFLVYGEWPAQIDHINGDRQDNRIENLRAVTNKENSRNAKTPKNNTSGVCGVTWHKASGKWMAGIRVDGKRKHLGLFRAKRAAAEAVSAAYSKFGFHKNHGRAA